MTVSARLRDFFDRHVSKMIMDKYGYDERIALKSFLASQTYRMLVDKSLEVHAFSPRAVFDMWECEKVTGNPRNSIYIRA